jgi:hypothetical protein
MTDTVDVRASAWSDAVVRAAAEASRLQPLATFLFWGALLLIVGQHVAEPLTYVFDAGGGEGLNEFGAHLVEALPALVLSFALWETRGYLGRLAKGELWGPSTARLLGRVGDCLLWAAISAVLVVPNLDNWLRGGFGGFNANFEAVDLCLAGVGLLLSLISRVVGNVVQVAASLKAENDQII